MSLAPAVARVNFHEHMYDEERSEYDEHDEERSEYESEDDDFDDLDAMQISDYKTMVACLNKYFEPIIASDDNEYDRREECLKTMFDLFLQNYRVVMEYDDELFYAIGNIIITYGSRHMDKYREHVDYLINNDFLRYIEEFYEDDEEDFEHAGNAAGNGNRRYGDRENN